MPDAKFEQIEIAFDESRIRTYIDKDAVTGEFTICQDDTTGGKTNVVSKHKTLEDANIAADQFRQE